MLHHCLHTLRIYRKPTQPCRANPHVIISVSLVQLRALSSCGNDKASTASFISLCRHLCLCQCSCQRPCYGSEVVSRHRESPRLYLSCRQHYCLRFCARGDPVIASAGRCSVYCQCGRSFSTFKFNCCDIVFGNKDP